LTQSLFQNVKKIQSERKIYPERYPNRIQPLHLKHLKMSAIKTDSLIIRKNEKRIIRERNEIGILVMMVKILTLMCDKLNEKLVLIGIILHRHTFHSYQPSPSIA